MELIRGLAYNWKGLRMGLKTPRLLMLGLVRLAAVVVLTALMAGLVIYYHRDLTELMWLKPESPWLVWLWYLVDTLLALMLVAVSGLAAYLLAQVLFCVFIMDRMSQVTEAIVTGRPAQAPHLPALRFFLFLLRQEVPRAVVPLMLTMGVMVLGWVTPLGPVVAVLSGAAAAVFLAWDNTDLVPARRLEPFAKRFGRLASALAFHLGFGLWFLIPGLNVLFLSWAPVGATLYHLDRQGTAAADPPAKVPES